MYNIDITAVLSDLSFKHSLIHSWLQMVKESAFFLFLGCNCHNHSEVCVYNETVAQMNKSLDIYGIYSGGGVCQNCQVN